MTARSTFVLLVAIAGVRADESKEIDLGGPRAVKGSVADDGTHYVVAVSLRPVSAFDATTNDDITREIAAEYAVRLLARHLSKADEIRLPAGGGELVKAGTDAGRYRASFRWPKDRVRLDGTDGDGGRVVKPATFAGKFFTAKRDHLDTLASVSKHASELVCAAVEAADKAPAEDRRRVLARAVAKAEDRGLAAFDALAAAVKDDKTLLDLTERPEVLDTVAKARRAFEAELRTALSDEAPKAAFKDVVIDEPFAAHLRKNPLLMDLAGAVVIDLGPDERLLIGVAKVLLKDSSADDLLRAEKVCTVKARAAVVGERDGVHLTYLKRVKDELVIVKTEEGEKATSVSERLKISQEKIEGMAKGLPVVGRWRSESGKVYYLAVGGRFDGKGNPKPFDR